MFGPILYSHTTEIKEALGRFSVSLSLKERKNKKKLDLMRGEMQGKDRNDFHVRRRFKL